MPFRLLGVVADPNQAGDLCGHAFARYAASGTDITLVCAAAREWNGSDHKAAAGRLGVRDLVLLDYRLSELTAAILRTWQVSAPRTPQIGVKSISIGLRNKMDGSMGDRGPLDPLPLSPVVV